jgi:hypothetical protein
MGQTEIYDFLYRQRASGNHKYWTVAELKKELGQSTYNVWAGCNKLYAFEFLEINIKVKDTGLSPYRRYFRLKKKFIQHGRNI